MFFSPLVLQDYFADSKRKVHKDQVQNYKLLYARENDTHTVLAFSRKLQTCDPDDREITVGENYSEMCSNISVIFIAASPQSLYYEVDPTTGFRSDTFISVGGETDIPLLIGLLL